VKLAYGTYVTWVTVRRAVIRIGVPGLLALLPVLPWWVRVPALAIALDGLWAYLRVLRSAWSFAHDTRAHDLFRRVLLDRLEWTGRGRLLDVGTGAGLAAIGAAKRFVEAEIVGTDTWSAGFIGLTQAACQRNARLESVADRVRFALGDAAALPYPDASFDAVISNSVFHLVSGGPYRALREALRVLRPGGVFSFNDPFEISTLYGSFDELRRQLTEMRCVEITYTPLATLIDIPPTMTYLTFGVGILTGRKAERGA
jgi:SAM-dependent methyltransferase